MVSPWYRRVFPTRLAPHRQAVQEFITTRQGYRLATSTGGVLTGRGADIILIDDPLKPEEALSEAQRQAANEWFDHTLYSRLNDKRHGAIVIIMQRLHEDDLVGHVLAQEAVGGRALSGDRRSGRGAPGRDDLGTAILHAPPGRSLAPRARAARHPRPHPPHDRRIQFRRPVSASTRAAGRRPGQGRMVQALRREERPERFDRIVQSWDTANKATELSDFSVCTTWGVRGKNLFLLDVLRRRLEYPALKRAVREQQSLFDASVVLIEDKASGTQLIQELIAEGCHAVTRYQPTTDKIMRLHAQTAMIENGFVDIPETAPWLAEYLHEMTVFPKGNTMIRSIRPPSSWTGSSARSQAKASTSTIGSAGGGDRAAAQAVTRQANLGHRLDGMGGRAGKSQTEWHFLIRIAARDHHHRAWPQPSPCPGLGVRSRFPPSAS